MMPLDHPSETMWCTVKSRMCRCCGEGATPRRAAAWGLGQVRQVWASSWAALQRCFFARRLRMGVEPHHQDERGRRADEPARLRHRPACGMTSAEIRVSLHGAWSARSRCVESTAPMGWIAKWMLARHALPGWSLSKETRRAAERKEGNGPVRGQGRRQALKRGGSRPGPGCELREPRR